MLQVCDYIFPVSQHAVNFTVETASFQSYARIFFLHKILHKKFQTSPA